MPTRRRTTQPDVPLYTAAELRYPYPGLAEAMGKVIPFRLVGRTIVQNSGARDLVACLDNTVESVSESPSTWTAHLLEKFYAKTHVELVWRGRRVSVMACGMRLHVHVYTEDGDRYAVFRVRLY